MRRPSPDSAPTGRLRAMGSLKAGLGAALVVLLISAFGLTWGAHPPDWRWLLVCLSLSCGLVGYLIAQSTLSRRLQAALDSQQALQELADSWLWRTDPQHLLVSWHPPAATAADGWLQGPTVGQPLYQAFDILDPHPCPGLLEARLAGGGLIPELRAIRRDHPHGPVWRLKAMPQRTSDGQFAGYLGSAIPVSDAEQRRFEQAVFQRLWPVLDQAAVALQAEGKGWRIQAISADAARLLQIPTDKLAEATPSTQAMGHPVGADWHQALATSDSELAKAAMRLTPGQGGICGDWQLDWVPLASSSGDQQDLLLFIRATQPQAAVEQVHDAPPADHESFIYSISHDLRAPLRVVDGFARILKEDYGRFLDRIGNDHLDRVLAAGARMNSMIDALLALSRLQSQPLTLKPVDLSQLAGFILEDLQREAPERQAILRIEPGLVVQGDPTLLRIAMENLLGNAWKYSGQCQQTVIEFRSERQADGRQVLVVADQGAGFDMRFADRLFGVFQRLHSPKDFQGTGVGLASVRRILLRHGGDIWAESEVGQGARFYFTVNPSRSASAPGKV